MAADPPTLDEQPHPHRLLDTTALAMLPLVHAAPDVDDPQADRAMMDRAYKMARAFLAARRRAGDHPASPWASYHQLAVAFLNAMGWVRTLNRWTPPWPMDRPGSYYGDQADAVDAQLERCTSCTACSSDNRAPHTCRGPAESSAPAREAQADQLGPGGDWLPVPAAGQPDLRALLRVVATAAAVAGADMEGAEIDAHAREFSLAMMMGDRDRARQHGVALASIVIRTMAVMPSGTSPTARAMAGAIRESARGVPPAATPAPPAGEAPAAAGPGLLSLPPRPMVVCPSCCSALASCGQCGCVAWIGRGQCSCTGTMACRQCNAQVAADGSGIQHGGSVAVWLRTGPCGACYLIANMAEGRIPSAPIPWHSCGKPNAPADPLTGVCNATADERHLPFQQLGVDNTVTQPHCGACGAR